MLLKKRSKNKEVKVLQQYLNQNGFILTQTGPGSPGKETEIFGPATEKAVKRWQKSNGLKDDGVVGPLTRNAMGLATTDITENRPKTSILNIKKQFLPKGEYFAGPTKKDWLFLHHTAGWDNPYNTISNWNNALGGCPGNGNDCNSITANPLFVNIDAHDFRLQSASPALTLGRTITEIHGSSGQTIPAGAYIDGNEIIGTDGALSAPHGLIIIVQ